MRIKHKDFASEIELNGTIAAKKISDALPIEANAQIWQEEVYFEVLVKHKLEDGTERVCQGDVAYWPPGRCFCIFFGKTQPVSAVTVVGKVKTGLENFHRVREGDKLILDKS